MLQKSIFWAEVQNLVNNMIGWTFSDLEQQGSILSIEQPDKQPSD